MMIMCGYAYALSLILINLYLDLLELLDLLECIVYNYVIFIQISLKKKSVPDSIRQHGSAVYVGMVVVVCIP